MLASSLRASLLACFLAPALAAPALAAPAEAETPSTPEATLGGQLFTDYKVPSGGFTLPGFELKRARIYAKARLDRTWSGAIVTNLTGLTYDASGKTAARPDLVAVERAYIQADGLLPTTRLQLGLIITPWFAYEASAWGYRMLGTLPSAGGLSPDRRGPSIVSFYDYGASLEGSLAAWGQPKFLSYSLAALNGEGSKHERAGADKSYEARLTVSPLAGLELTGMLHRQNPSFVAGVANREALVAVYRFLGARLAFEGNWVQEQADATAAGTSGSILGAWAIVPVPGMPLPTEVVLRADRLTGGRKSLDPSLGYRYETIAGVSVQPVKGVRLVLDNQNIDFHRPDGTPDGNENIVYLHSELSF